MPDEPTIRIDDRPSDVTVEQAPPTVVTPLAPPKPERVVGPRGRRPAVGLAALVVFGLVAAFFGWVSADPFWLAVGKGYDGTATITQCPSSTHCEGRFIAAGKLFTVDSVSVSGVPDAARVKGATTPAWMLSSKRTWAYAGPGWGLHLRWVLGLIVTLLCGVLIAVATGTRHLRPLGRGAVVGGRILAMLAPLLLFAGMIGAALVL